MSKNEEGYLRFVFDYAMTHHLSMSETEYMERLFEETMNLTVPKEYSMRAPSPGTTES